MANKNHQRNRCLFCDNYADSKEHIWANWIKDYIPRLPEPAKSVHSVIDPSGAMQSGKLNRAGDSRSQRLRVVCDDCNTGWMSRLQTSAKNHIVDLIEGRAVSSDAGARETISRWAIMFTYVFETADLSTANSISEMRSDFRSLEQLPAYWRVYAARSSIPDNHVVVWRTGGWLVNSETDQRIPSQATVINLKNWSLLTAYGPIGVDPVMAGFMQIWPTFDGVMTTNEVTLLGLQQLMLSMVGRPSGTKASLERFFNEAGVRLT